MVSEEELRRQNPWWESPSAIDDDGKIAEWSDSKIRHDPGLRQEIRYDFEPGNTVVYTLRGPRQVGKTTLMKLQIRDFLRQGKHPWNILYCSLDLEETPKDMVAAVNGYLQISERRRRGRAYMFLDEASSIRNWQKGVKYMVDAGMLPDCTIMATGSQTMRIERSSERMPGRRGDAGGNLDHVLLPAKFSEYARMCSPRIRKFMDDNATLDARRRALKGLASGRIDKTVEDACARMDELNVLLKMYMLTGGTPKIVSEYEKSGSVPDKLYHVYLESVLGQWEDAGWNKDVLKQVSGAVIKAMGSHASWKALSDGTDLGSVSAAKNSVDLLRGLFVLSIVHRYGHDKKIPMTRKERKIYFTDPFFIHMFNAWTRGGGFLESVGYRDGGADGPVLEGIVAAHLARWAFDLSDQKQIFDPHNHVFYWVDGKGREVDFVCASGRMQVPIEVKYRNRMRPTELAPLTQFLDATGTKTGLVLSKNTLDDKKDYVIVPACVFLMLV